MAEHFRLEFKEDQSGHRNNQLRRFGVGYQYLIGSDGFDPADRNDVRDLVDELMREESFKNANERDLTYQLSRMRKEDLGRGIQIRV